jgi:hypothetical protein
MESDELRELVYANVFEPFWRAVTHAPLAAYVDVSPFVNQVSHRLIVGSLW